MQENKQNNKTPDIFYLVNLPEYPEHFERSSFQSAEITVFVTHGVPTSASNGLFRLTYQRNVESNPKSVSHWYGETIENITDPRYDSLKTIAGVFQKMEKYLQKIHDKGLSLDVARADDVNWRIALLKKIGAYPVDWNNANRAYTSYEYCMKTKESCICIG